MAKTFKELEAFYGARLRKREEILKYYYGEGGQNVQKTADKFHLTRQRIYQILEPEKQKQKARQ